MRKMTSCMECSHSAENASNALSEIEIIAAQFDEDTENDSDKSDKSEKEVKAPSHLAELRQLASLRTKFSDIQIPDFGDYEVIQPSRENSQTSYPKQLIPTKLQTFGQVPPPVWGHTAVAIEDKIWLFGGDGDRVNNDIYFLEAESMKWTRPRCIGGLKGRFGHTMSSVGNKLYIFGGRSRSKFFNDVNIFDTDTFSWSIPPQKRGGPPPLSGHSTTLVGFHKLVVFGGAVMKGKSEEHTNHVYILDTATMTWTKPRVKGTPPSPRCGHVAVAAASLMFVFGGYDGKQYYNDLHVFSSRSCKWTRMEKMGGFAPKPRSGHTATIVGNALFIVGGCNESSYFNDLHVLDLETMTWKNNVCGRVNNLGSRFRHTTSRIRNKLFIIGGTSDKAVYSDVQQFLIPLMSGIDEPHDDDSNSMARNVMNLYLHATLQLKSEMDTRRNLESKVVSFENELALEKRRTHSLKVECGELKEQLSKMNEKVDTLEEEKRKCMDANSSLKKELLKEKEKRSKVEMEVQELTEERISSLSSPENTFATSLTQKPPGEHHCTLDCLMDDQTSELSLSELETLEDRLLTKLNVVRDRTKYLRNQMVRELERQKEELSGKSLCSVCLDEETSVLLLPCRHLCLCKKCGNKLSRCPMCRQTVKSRINVYG